MNERHRLYALQHEASPTRYLGLLKPFCAATLPPSKHLRKRFYGDGEGRDSGA
jgi:hypothetical protein